MDKEDDLMLLPPGFRFHPTDEEIITNYLTEKVMNSRFAAKAIGEVDLNRCEPWDLPKKAKMGEKEWFFFVQRDRKYPTGMRTNRATESGYWKATGKDKEIFKGKGNLVGMKKTLVFYKGRAPKGEKTNWVMHEYRLDGKFSYHSFPKAAKDEWVVSKIFHKSTGIRRSPISEFARNDSFVDHLINSPPLPGLLEHTPENSSFKNGTDQEEYGNFYMNGVQMSQDQKGFYAPNFNYTDFNKNQQAGSSTSVPNPIFYPQISHQIMNFSYEASPNLSYQNQERSVFVSGYNSQPVVRCKAEQFSSNNSMVSISQDTGLSTDVGGPEISSVISNPGNGGDRSFDDLRAAHLNADSSFSVSDLDFFWD